MLTCLIVYLLACYGMCRFGMCLRLYLHLAFLSLSSGFVMGCFVAQHLCGLMVICRSFPPRFFFFSNSSFGESEDRSQAVSALCPKKYPCCECRFHLCMYGLQAICIYVCFCAHVCVFVCHRHGHCFVKPSLVLCFVPVPVLSGNVLYCVFVRV